MYPPGYFQHGFFDDVRSAALDRGIDRCALSELPDIAITTLQIRQEPLALEKSSNWNETFWYQMAF